MSASGYDQIADDLPIGAVPVWWRVIVRHRVGRRLDTQPKDVLIKATDRADLSAQLADIKGAIDGYHRAIIHTCSICNRSGPWTETWGWYGSLADVDAGNAIVKTCSTACLDRAKGDKIIPRNAPTIDDSTPLFAGSVP